MAMQNRNSLGFSILVLKKNPRKKYRRAKSFIPAYYNTWYGSYDMYLHVYFKIKHKFLRQCNCASSIDSLTCVTDITKMYNYASSIDFLTCKNTWKYIQEVFLLVPHFLWRKCQPERKLLWKKFPHGSPPQSVQIKWKWS